MYKKLHLKSNKNIFDSILSKVRLLKNTQNTLYFWCEASSEPRNWILIHLTKVTSEALGQMDKFDSSSRSQCQEKQKFDNLVAATYSFFRQRIFDPSIIAIL